MILLGALISTSLSETISSNTSGVDISKLGKDFSNSDNIMLRQNDTLRMGDYYVTYKGKRSEAPNIYYEIQYLAKDISGKYIPEFTLHPLVQTNPRMGNITRVYEKFDDAEKSRIANSAEQFLGNLTPWQ